MLKKLVSRSARRRVSKARARSGPIGGRSTRGIAPRRDAPASAEDSGLIMSLVSRARAHCRDRVHEEALDACHLRIAGVPLARPEEPAQTILAAARNHVNVEMGHALADPVVDRDERPLGA